MMQLKLECLTKELKAWKYIVVSLVFVFVIGPALAFLFGPSLGKVVGTSFVISKIVPALSSSLGYVLIAGAASSLPQVCQS